MTEKIGQEVRNFSGYGCCKEIRDALRELKWKYTIQGFKLQPQRAPSICVVYLCINVADVSDSCIKYVVKQGEDLPADGKKFFSANRRTNKVTAEKMWKGGEVQINITKKPSYSNRLELYYPSENVLLSVPIPSKTPGTDYCKVGYVMTLPIITNE